MKGVEGRPRSARVTGPGVMVVLATVLAGAVLVVVTGPVTLAAVAVVLLVLTGLALRSSSSAAIDAVVMTDLLYVAVHVNVLGPWPLPAAIAVAVAGAAASRSPRAALWRSWLRRGRNTPETLWLLLATIVITAIALTVWQQVFNGQLPDVYRNAALGRPVWMIAVAATGFAVLNAGVEEAIFRGVLQTSLQQFVGPITAIAVQAAAFGLLHVAGIPSGAVGALMAGAWGALLGVLRYRTRGILAPYVAHIAADVTIAVMLLPTLT